MVEKIYKKALNYAHKLDPEFYKDLVHDAYLEWYKKKNESLLDQHEGVLIQTIKNVHRSNFTRSTFMWRGQVKRKVFIDIEARREDQSNPNLYVEYKHHYYDSETPLGKVIVKDMQEQLVKTLTETERLVYDDYMAGYTPTEIAQKMGTYRQQINHKVKHIVNKFDALHTEVV